MRSIVAMASTELLPAQRDEEARWVEASRGGDADAFERLILLHQHRVFKLAGRFFRRREDVEDAAQETFLRAWTKLGSYRAEAPFEHWLTRVCLNLCYERLRKRRPDAETSVEAIAPPAAPQTDLTASMEVERLLVQLDPKDRFMLLLLEGEGWSVAEVAERLGWSRTNVKVRAHRARRRLRRLVEQEA